MRSMWIISPIIAIGLITSAPAQQQVDQNTRQQIEQLNATFHDNWNKHDAIGLANLYTDDGMLVTDRTGGAKKGHKEIEDYYTNTSFKRVPHHDSGTIDELVPLGSNAVIAVGEYHLSGQGENGPIKADGHYTAVDVLEGGAWKIRLLTATPNPPPAQSTAR
jgi:uncharacterized protein (TIGR02246 family)